MTIRRALVCAPRLPEFDREGGSRRIMHLVELLRELGWAVTYIARDATGGERYARLLRAQGVATYAGRESRFVGDDYLPDPNRLIAAGRFDLALLCFWETAESFLPALRALSPDTRVIIDSIDLHFLRNARNLFRRRAEAGAWAGDGLDGDYGDQVARELNAYAAADAVLAVSRKEADLIGDLTAEAGLAHAVPDIEDLAPSQVPPAERRGILFVGNFRHPPNVDAARHLCRDILPLIDPALLAAHPVDIVGNALERALDELDCRSPHVRPVGWVPSVVPYLARSRLTVVPLRTGAGTKRKLIQALMVGTPTVSTSIGTEGLDVRDGEDVLVADEPAAFAAAVARLLTDDALWARLAARGRVRAGAAHSREAIRARFAAVLDATLAKPPKRSAADPLGRGGGRPPGHDPAFDEPLPPDARR